MSPRPNDDPRSAAVRALLADIGMQRELRDRANASAEKPMATWLENGELDRHARGAQDGLEALVFHCLNMAEPPSDDDLADAAGMSLDEIEALRARLEAARAAEEQPARGRFGLRRRKG